jgi:hypothetical protein
MGIHPVKAHYVLCGGADARGRPTTDFTLRSSALAAFRRRAGRGCYFQVKVIVKIALQTIRQLPDQGRLQQTRNLNLGLEARKQP